MASVSFQDRSLEGVLNAPSPAPPDTWQTVEKILALRRDFGITRLGSVTGLDRIGIPVVQVVRPASRSVSVNQGKGLSYAQAAISGLMESLEGWASERIPAERVWRASLADMNADGMWSHLHPAATPPADSNDLAWISGWDLISGSFRPVPLAAVDTNYVIPSPHPHWLQRNTTGLAAGTSLQQALIHGCLEILERHAHHLATRRPHFFDRYQIGVDTIGGGKSGEILGRLRQAGLAAGVWALPSPSGLPAYWCHVMEDPARVPLAPLPASGFGCDIDHDPALAKALLEACQSRLGAIAATREDVIGRFYAPPERSELIAWFETLSRGGLPFPENEPAHGGENPLPAILEAMVAAGVKAVVVVVLFSDEALPLHVVRVVAPPLEVSIEE
ncbi:YcaO-like family protein [Ensifer sp. ENS07]|uniref:YcaO-like family protein n=1 Tax=Ensifer adhaerens TaxID=106592 RepID=A0A9Q8Y772_ENSAD|nr:MULTISPECIES: YcaO-like family protein [Ensifer]MBD9521153.1 YcaO-like family protein [Ensifer sp. ENS02]MBD9634881.1 YcaO-like family protein [Ensifer sp. ENS07]USJ23775.1 YcaO-like family protein [Ensifer adhaerens]